LRNEKIKIGGRNPTEKVVQWILEEKLDYTPGAKHLYSDLGYILLGYIIETVTGKNLDVYWLEKVIQPLNLEDHFCFYPESSGLKNKVVTTGICPWSQEKLSGRVHDDNCRAMGGVAGHAGLFGTAEGIRRVCENIVSQAQGLSSHPGYDKRLLDKSLKKSPNTTWCLGFDSPSENSSSGKYLSKMSRGHLGFTGTSFWIDLKNNISIVFLTNRVLLSKQEDIQKIRPVVHNMVMEELLYENP
jgi:CubicO group peptidase (beta-lactamase class C family)